MKWILLFTVFLDGAEIGTHRFAMEEEGVVVSEADFRVRLLGFTVHRYRHRAVERWRGDCLESLVSRTDDGGEALAVDWRAGEGCTMSFAYWNPRMLESRELLNPETGELEPVRITPLGDGRYRVNGRDLEIDLSYARGGWTGLETTVDGRRLTYRLESRT